MKWLSFKPQTKAGLGGEDPGPKRREDKRQELALTWGLLGQLQLLGLAWHSWQRAAVVCL